MRSTRFTLASYLRAGMKIGHCDRCDKVIHLTRKAARHAAKVIPGANRPRAFPCPHVPGHWHVGHLPDAVRQGQIDRDEYRAHLGGSR